LFDGYIINFSASAQVDVGQSPGAFDSAASICEAMSAFKSSESDDITPDVVVCCLNLTINAADKAT